MQRDPVKKNLREIQTEEAHGGSGMRQVILSGSEPFVSKQIEAMTKGFLPVGAKYDWHKHDGIDEFFLVLHGKGIIEYENKMSFEYEPDDVVYIPAGLAHRIINKDATENRFYFIRVKE